jgi:hypothetical protein
MATSLTSAVTVTSPKSMMPRTRRAPARTLSGLKSLWTSCVRWAASLGATSAVNRLSCSSSRPVSAVFGRSAISGLSWASWDRSQSWPQVAGTTRGTGSPPATDSMCFSTRT